MALEISLFEYITKIFTALMVGREARVNYMEVKFVLKSQSNFCTFIKILDNTNLK